ncbi:MAG TPA: hypothetical protein VIP56_01570, partial [Nitrososphaeraceae archaeon]
LIYYCSNNNMSMSTTTTTTTNSLYMYGEQQHYIPSQDYFMEHYTAMLLHEAEKLYTKLVKDLTNRVVSDMAFSNNNDYLEDKSIQKNYVVAEISKSVTLKI